ncbi:MAG: YkgJ family cysteine cluster protein [Hyphomicrobium sp.]
MTSPGTPQPVEISDSQRCQSCGACCAFDESWPRFSLESEREIAAIPEALVSASGSGMRCEGGRCCALSGEIGKHAACTVYAVRPLVCRDCQPGDEECNMARARYGFPALAPR